MAEDWNRFRCYDQHQGVFGRRSLPTPGMTSTPERSPVGVPKSSSNISWRDKPSLNLDKHQHSYKGRPLPDAFTKDYKGRLLPDHKMSFGTPSYPSPLDRIRMGHQDRTFQPGFGSAVNSNNNNASFEGNQSFPKTSKPKTYGPARKLDLNSFKGSELNEVSFSAGFSKGSFHQYPDRSSDQSVLDRSFPSRDASLNHSRDINGTSSKESSMYASSGEKSLESSWSFYNYIGGGDTGISFPTTVRNPNKAICTINGKTSEILIANEMACELFGYEEAELIGMMLNELVRLKPRDQATIQESHLEPSGEVVSLSGKVIEAVDKTGLVLPVSMWVKKLDPRDDMRVNNLGSEEDDCLKADHSSAETKKVSEPRCLVVMEPVERSVATLKFMADGTIIACDGQMAYIHGYKEAQDLQGSHIRDLIPAFKLPVPGESLTKDVRKQRATGRTKDGASFPLSVAVELCDDSDDDVADECDIGAVYRGVIWVFANISGLITILPDGTVHSINENFSLMLFGYRASEVVGKSISVLIPDFYEILDLVDDSMPLPPLDDDASDVISNTHLSINSNDSGRISCCTSSKGVGGADSDDQGMGSSITSSTVCTRPDPGGVANQMDVGGVSHVTANESKYNAGCKEKHDSENLVQSCAELNYEDVANDVRRCMAKDGMKCVVKTDTIDVVAPSTEDQSGVAGVKLQVEDSAVRDAGGMPVRNKVEGILDMGGFSLHGPGSTSTPNRSTQALSNVLSGGVSAVKSPLVSGADSVAVTTSVLASPANVINISSDTSQVTTTINISSDSSSPLATASTSSCNVTPLKAKEPATGTASSSHTASTDVIVIGSDSSSELECVDDEKDKSAGLVFRIDSATGKYESELPIDEKKVIKTDVDATAGPVETVTDTKLPTSHVKAEFGSSTPDVKCLHSIKKADILASPCLSDILRLDSSACSPCDSSAFEGDDVIEDSDAKTGKADTTDDLIEAAIGMVKMTTLNNSESNDIYAKGELCENEIKAAGRTGKSLSNGGEKSSCTVLTDSTGASKLDCGDDSVVVLSSEEESLVSDRSTEVSDTSNRSTIEVLENVDMSSLHRTSVNRFLSSRCSNRSRNIDTSKSFLGQSRSQLEGSSIQSMNNSDKVEMYYPLGFETPDRNSNNACGSVVSDELSGCSEGHSPSLCSFEHHEKGVRYVMRSGNGSKSSDYSSNGTLPIPEGSYQGQCQHRDSSLLGIVFQIRRVQLEDGSHVYCMWVSRDPEEPGECGRSYANLTLASSLNSTAADLGNFSLGEALIERAHSASKNLIEEDEIWEGKQVIDDCHADDVPCKSVSPPMLDNYVQPASSLTESEEDRALNHGPYSLKYQTLHSIGKGAFGFVKLAQRRVDKKTVVVKFIRRSKVFSDCWVSDDRYGGRLPLEVSLLTKLNHPNIVRVVDVFENSEFIQMVMEKHGSGMDLFEFIDRSPLLDEPLISYIFRQMVSAVAYLHNKNILHRDIKDENVILNEHFQIKLIDFGAVAFMQPGKLFATFCGTLEYCSPEVLMGNRYKGPELEVWSMGVTLYTLIFGENPFFDTDETIKCVLKPPFAVSNELMMLLYRLLHPEPRCRASISSLEKNSWIHQPIDIEDYKWSEVLPNTEFHGNTASDNRPDSPPVSDRQSGHSAPPDPQIDELKCNLLNQLNLSDHDHTNPFSRKY